jgi:sugar fermentation stimulation protein A
MALLSTAQYTNLPLKTQSVDAANPSCARYAIVRDGAAIYNGSINVRWGLLIVTRIAVSGKRYPRSEKPEMDFGKLVAGTFLRRDNRFRVQVKIEGQREVAHLPNSGRLGELLVPGRHVWLSPVDLQTRPHRRTAFDLALVEYSGRLVSVDARLPGKLIGRALEQGQLNGFERYAVVQREVRLGNSRIDYRLQTESNAPRCWIEVKSVTLVEDSTAMFPDAPTLRGQRHVRELMDAVKNGERAAIVFVVQRDDPKRFEPHDQADPEFARTLRKANMAGVEVYAWRCRVTRKAIDLAGTIPVAL